LRLAAQRRSAEEAGATPENHAIENEAIEQVLYLFYDGEEQAVQAMLKFLQGVDEKIVNTHGETFDATYAQIKAAAGAKVSLVGEAAQDYPAKSSEIADYPVQSDPTMANAAFTELNDVPLSNGHKEDVSATNGVLQAEVGEGNAMAEANWDNTSPNEMSTSQEWVKVTPRDATETENGVAATIAAPAQIQSWADEKPDTPPPATAAVPAPQNGDGFEQVNRNRGPREGGWRGGDRRGGRGEYRGRGRGGDRGGRGEYRGRGRGGPYRGRRPDEA